MVKFDDRDDGIHVPDVSAAPQVFERGFSEFATFEDVGLKLEELPKPTLWRVLVLPKQPKKMSAGGIALPTMAVDAERHLNFIGQVLALGPLAGKSDKFLNPDWQPGHYDKPRWLWDVKVGDWVVYGRYAGMAKEFKGVKLLTVNDDEITEVISGPDGFRVYL